MSRYFHYRILEKLKTHWTYIIWLIILVLVFFTGIYVGKGMSGDTGNNQLGNQRLPIHISMAIPEEFILKRIDIAIFYSPQSPQKQEEAIE